jgi:hypothetical protein
MSCHGSLQPTACRHWQTRNLKDSVCSPFHMLLRLALLPLELLDQLAQPPTCAFTSETSVHWSDCSHHRITESALLVSCLDLCAGLSSFDNGGRICCLEMCALRRLFVLLQRLRRQTHSRIPIFTLKNPSSSSHDSPQNAFPSHIFRRHALNRSHRNLHSKVFSPIGRVRMTAQER